MKKLKSLVLLVIVVFCFTAMTGWALTPKEAINKKSKTISNVLNGTYKIDNESYKLKNGESVIEAAPGSATKTITKVWNKPVVGDLNGDKTNDAALVLIQDPGGSGTFSYVAASITSKIGQSISTNAIFLGDRINTKSVKIKNGTIIVNYLDRKSTEPMAAKPTVKKTKSFIVKNNSLVEKK